MIKLVLALLAGVLLFSASANAADIMESQQNMEFVIEQGGSVEFILLIFNTESNDVLFPYGGIDDWITFGDTNLAIYEAENRGIDWPKITIDVPESAEVGEYEGGITSNTDAAAITVKVVPRLDEIKSMQDIEVMKEELRIMAESISGELNNTKKSLQEKINEVSEYQQNITSLENEITGLRGRSEELEEENAELTGQVVSSSPAQMALGAVAGIILVLLVLYRASISKAFKRSGTAATATPSEYRGWKP